MPFPPFYEPGITTIVTGSPGTGKSNSSMVMCEIALQKIPELEILSNVKLSKPIDRYHHFVGECDFLWHMTQVKRALVIFDEAGIYATSGAGDNRKRRGQLEAFLKLIRKFDMSMIWIDQVYDQSVPPAVRKLGVYNIDMPWKGAKDFYLIDNNGDRHSQKRLKNIILTSIPYLHKGMSDFTLNLPDKLTLHDVFSHLANTNPDLYRDKLKKMLMCHRVAPPQNTDYLTRTERERYYSGAGKDDVNVTIGKNRFSGISPDDKIPSRVQVWGILQDHPKYSTKDLMKLFHLSRSSVQKYRNEYNGRIKTDVD